MDLVAQRASEFSVLVVNHLFPDTASIPGTLDALAFSTDSKHETLGAEYVEEHSSDHVGFLRPHGA